MSARRVAVGLLTTFFLAFAGTSCGEASTRYPPDGTLTPSPTPGGVPRPGYLDPVTDAEFGTEVTRISDPKAFGERRKRVIRHIYAKNEPWNSDESLLMLDWGYPASLLDGQTHRFLRVVHQPSQAIWLNTNPNRTIGTAENRLIEWNMRKDHLARVDHEFRGYRSIDLGHGEGNLSNDDRFVALFGILPRRRIDLIVYDRERGRVVSRHRFKHATVGDDRATFNNVTMSQSGRFLIAEFNRRGHGRRSGIVAYPRGRRPVLLSAAGGSHFDACVDTEGHDVIVVGADQGLAINSVRLADGRRTTVVPAAVSESYAIHVSCRNIHRPGWAYISDFAVKGHSKRPGEVFAVRLDRSGTVERFAHTHTSGNPAYERAPMAVPSRDGSRVLFASDWELAKGPVLAYVAREP